MTEEEIHARMQAALLAEASEPERWFWLSFADGTLPKGQQFLGACLVRGRGVSTAIRQSHRLGINPGGEVLAAEVPSGVTVEDRWANRLLTKEEAESDELTKSLRPRTN